MSADNREILFRGFHPCEDGDTTIYVEGEAVKGRWTYGDLIKIESQRFIFDYDIGDNGISDIQTLSEIRFEVLTSTVCRYTGLTDKNGVKIFEGDKCNTRCAIVKVIYSVDNVAFMVEFEGGTINHFAHDASDSYEVIGTIWDKEA